MKGQLEVLFAAVVLTLVSALALFLLAGQTVDDEGMSVTNCKVKIGLAAGVKKGTLGVLDIGAYCPRSEVIFDNEKPEEINERISKELYWCGDRFYFGDVDFTPMNNIMQQDKLNCLICTMISFENPTVISRYKEGQTLREYMVENNAPQQTKSYKSYFMTINNKAKNREQDLQYHYSEDINPEEDMVIVFANSPTGTVLTNIVELIPGFSSFRKDIVSPKLWGIEEPYPHNYVFMGETEEILGYCDNILN